MASSSSFFNVKPWLCLSFLFVLQTSLLAPICNCQPQNIETFFPPQTPPPAPPPNTSPPPPIIPPPGPAETTKSSSSSNSKVGKAVAITAASTAVVSALVFFFIRWCLKKRRREERRVSSASEPGDGNGRDVVTQTNTFERIEGNVKGLIVDENGLDVIYWRKLQDKKKKNSSKKGLQREVRTIAREQDHQEQEEDDGSDGGGDHHRRKKSEPVQEIPLLRGKSSASEKNLLSKDEHGSSRSWRRTFSRKKAPPPPPPPPQVTTTAAPTVSPPLPPPPAAYFNAASKAKNVEPPPRVAASSSVSPPLPPPPSAYFSAANKTKSTEPPPPPPPPPPSIPDKKAPAPPPPPPPAPAKKSAAPPPPPPVAGNLRSSSKPPPTPVEMSGEENDKVKLKPLHWDKVTTNADHSMVWDKLDRGSFRVDQDLMEALFGYVATSKRTPRGKNDSSSPSKEASAAQSSTTFILESRKSQNIAIVLRSLAVSRREILEALDEGQGLNSDIIEKLVRVAPTQEEQSEIIGYNGDPSRLAVAESFLYDILKAVPSAFKRLNAMLFRFNYDSEILEIKESLNTLESGCKELRNRGLFVKLLEAVLKAGNRMNAGTSRGNAQAFNLTSLRKLSDVKSTDGKTTLLHFVVEEVVRSEGKRCVLNRDRSLNRNGSSRRMNNKGDSDKKNSVSDEQREAEYLKLGLPFVGGISTEFSNVKKAAIIDYNTLVSSISSLSTRIAEIKQVVSQCGNGIKGGNFVREMEHFLTNAEEELRSLREEQTRVFQIVKKTTEYYQGGAFKDKAENLLEIFVIVKDFLGMVDQACIDIARSMQKKKTTKSNSG